MKIIINYNMNLFIKKYVYFINKLLEKISPFIKKQDTAFRIAISPEERLTIILR